MNDLFRNWLPAGMRGRIAGGVNGIAWWANIRLAGVTLALAALCRLTIARRVRVIAVVGSYGKTTTTRAIRSLLGLPDSSWVDANANCFSLVACALFRGMLESRTVVVEVGTARPGQMARYARALRPSVVVVTCIGSEHVQSYRDIGHLRDEEATIVAMLPAGGVAVLNGDDPLVATMAAETRARVVTFGRSAGLDVVATDVAAFWPRGTRMSVHAAGRVIPVETRLIGEGMATVALAALAVALAIGLPLEAAARTLETLPPTPGRMQPLPLACGAVVLRDDYKSTVDTVVAALDALAGLPAGRRVVVLGDLDSPPAPEREWYRRIGAQVARVADEVVFVGTKHDRYRAGLRRADRTPAIVEAVRTAAEAAAFVAPRLGPGDVVLVKGRETQRLTRVVLALQGRRVGCTVECCRMHLTFCDDCPLLGLTAAPAAAAGTAAEADDR